MEKHEVLNQVLKPLDDVVEHSLTGLKKANLYEPLKKAIYTSVRKALMTQFRLVNKLEVSGEENVPTEGGVIYAINHTSWLDAQVVSASSPRKVSFLAKADFESWPLLRHVINLNDGIYVRRGGDNEALETIAQKLAEGACVAIFPEGTIPGEEDWGRWDVEPHTGLLRGKSGAVRLALMSGAVIVPVGVSGASKAFPPEAYPRMEKMPLPQPAPVKVTYGKPIKIEKPEGEISYEYLRTKTDEVMIEISKLVDFSMAYEPITLPLQKKTAPSALPPFAYKNAPVKQKRPVGALILHGFTSHVACVADLRHPAEQLGMPYRVPVLRGHGTKWQDLNGVKRQDWYEDAENALLDLLTECEKVIIVGLSMGGLVALDLAAHHKEHVAGLVTVAAALKFADPFAGLTPLLAAVVPSWPSPKAYHDKSLEAQRNQNYPKFPPKAFLELYEYAQEMENRLSFVRCPTLVLHSRVDQVVHPKAADVIYEKIQAKDKRLVWFEKSGHEMLLDMEAPQVTETIVDFFKQLSK